MGKKMKINTKYQNHNCPVNEVNEAYGEALRVAISGAESSWRPVTRSQYLAQSWSTSSSMIWMKS